MAQQPDAGIQCHGKKRPAESEPQDQPLAKRLGLLHIEPTIDANYLQRQHGLPEAQTPQKSADPMLLDDTKHTVFIHDIDREILDDNAQGGVFDFLPGVTENLMTIPKAFVVDAEPCSTELVLYREPKSLSIPVEGEDFVKRAIVEMWTRARARVLGKQNDSGFFSTISPPKGTYGAFHLDDNEKRGNHYWYGDNYIDEGDDDLMDID